MSRIREDDQLRLEKDQRLEDIRVHDKISVDAEGRGLLSFSDSLLVEVFRGSEIELSEARVIPGQSALVRLKQIFGHSRTKLESVKDARVSVETGIATITSLDEGTEFLVCHAPDELTCTVTLAGATLVEAQGETVEVGAGEASYIYPGQPPRPTLCAKPEEVMHWLERKREMEDVEALGALVFEWPQEPCGMVGIEGGVYTVGGTVSDDNHIAAFEIRLPAFWIDQFEVTNVDYERFLFATNRLAPGHQPGGTFPPGEGNHPVKGVSWDLADAYCTWVNKRLPLEAEWEIAARGSGQDPPLYPWGSDPTAGGQIADLPLTGTYEVGTKSINKSPFDVYDMAGNVWEWVGESYGALAEGQKLLRGGRFGLIRDMAYRQQAEADDAQFASVAGFRCAVGSVDEQEQ